MFQQIAAKSGIRTTWANWNGYLTLALIFVLLVPALFTGPPPLQVVDGSALQPQLLEMTTQHPESIVRVIVQAREPAQLAELITDLGGQVTKDLHIIRALAAEMPADAVERLALHPTVRWVSLDAPVVSTASHMQEAPELFENTYLDTLGVPQVWNLGIDGEGIGVAVIDSGIQNSQDFSDLDQRESFNPNSTTADDVFGHGTHVAGIIAGNGDISADYYGGIAPGVSLYGLKISDEAGMAYESDTVAALQWVYDHKDQYNIRVVNLSINASVESSYHNSPLDAAAEILWFNSVVVVTSVGNKGPGGGLNTVDAAPANDPFLIAVGASDEKGDSERRDVIAPFSAHGTTDDGYAKPDIIAPGVDIVSVLSDISPWDEQYPERAYYWDNYFRLSGTSMSAPMVTGAVALLLQDEPNLTPDQVKYRLIETGGANPVSGYPYLDVHAAVTSTTTESANTGTVASQLLWSGDEPVEWESVNWNSVNWNSVNWNSVNWNSVNWNSVNWNSTTIVEMAEYEAWEATQPTYALSDGTTLVLAKAFEWTAPTLKDTVSIKPIKKIILYPTEDTMALTASIGERAEPSSHDNFVFMPMISR